VRVAKRVRNRFGLVSEVPDDYPQELLRQLGLAVEAVEEEGREDRGTEETEPQPQREGRRRR
jgi:hypothetical protein